MSHFDEELFGCLIDKKICFIGCCVPGGCFCLQASAVNKATGKGLAVPYLLDCFLLCSGGAINRGKLRVTYEIEGSFVNDCLTWMFCGPCAGCQEYREVNKR